MRHGEVARLDAGATGALLPGKPCTPELLAVQAGINFRLCRIFNVLKPFFVTEKNSPLTSGVSGSCVSRPTRTPHTQPLDRVKSLRSNVAL